MTMEVVLQAMQLRIVPLERFIDLFAAELGNPILCGPDGNKAYRYDKPDIRHFCLLKCARIVSALNAIFELVRKGYSQEVCVLLRTVAEFTSHVEYVLDTGSNEYRTEVDIYLKAFFQDSERAIGAQIVQAKVSQGVVHAKLGETLDLIAKQLGQTDGRMSASKLYTNIYRIFSNYVHGRYPEIMDLYGGVPGRFHLTGMAGTRKDSENLQQLETWVETVSNTFVIMIRSLRLGALVNKDRDVDAWYRQRSQGEF